MVDVHLTAIHGITTSSVMPLHKIKKNAICVKKIGKIRQKSAKNAEKWSKFGQNLGLVKINISQNTLEIAPLCDLWSIYTNSAQITQNKNKTKKHTECVRIE